MITDKEQNIALIKERASTIQNSIFSSQIKAGKLGELRFELECLNKKWIYEKTSLEEELQTGIDYKVLANGKWIAVDVKNTEDLYFLRFVRFDVKNNYNPNKFFVRHPYKKNTQATHFFFTNVSSNVDVKKLEECSASGLTRIEEYLLDFFPDKESILNFLQIIQSFDNITLDDLKTDSEDYVLCELLKKSLKPLVKTGITIIYDNLEESSSEISVRLRKDNPILVKRRTEQNRNSCSRAREILKKSRPQYS